MSEAGSGAGRGVDALWIESGGLLTLATRRDGQIEAHISGGVVTLDVASATRLLRWLTERVGPVKGWVRGDEGAARASYEEHRGLHGMDCAAFTQQFGRCDCDPTDVLQVVETVVAPEEDFEW